MPIVFQIAPTITSGSVPLASHMAGLANAINSRIASGLGDGCKRIHQYTGNLTRQIRNRADALTFPSLMEFPAYYQQLDFDRTPATWPEAEAGEPEGANVASPAAAFVFGIGDERGGTPGEGDNFTTYNFFVPDGTTPEHYWDLAKSQRGAYDPFTTAQNAPMYDLSQRHFALTFPEWSRHHKSPGGYLPTPQKSDTDCRRVHSRTGFDTFWTSYIYKFKRLSDQVIVYTGTGTCGPSDGGSATDVAYLADYPFAWYVFQYDGVVYRFDKSDYILVLDGGGTPSREDGGQIQRLMVNPFIHDFRGTEAQRTQTCFTTPYIDYAFGNQEFFTSQYQLAPAYGIENNGNLDAYYPSITVSTAASSGSINPIQLIPDGFRVGGHLIKQSKLANDVDVQILQNGSVMHSFTIYKASGSMVETFLDGPEAGVVSYRFADDVTFTDASGYIYLEQSLLVDYKPEIWDAYAVIRMSSALGGIGDGQMDARGIDATYSRTLYDNYRAYGCVFNIHGEVAVEQQQAAINTNPVFDAMRKYLNSFTRTINGTDMRTGTRPMLVGYQVSQSISGMVTQSRSILYFNRYQAGTGLTTNNLDAFVDLVNTTDSASNGIVTTAPKQGYTNEWLLELCGKPYHPSISSNWEPEVYANYYGLINRCHLAAPYFECGPVFGKDLFRFFQENSPQTTGEMRNRLLAPESLTAYNYDTSATARNQLNKKAYDDPEDANGIIAKAFYQSCQIYPKPYNIESVVVQSGDIVKVTLDTRLQYCSGSAPDIIANDVSSWDFNTVAAEPYRTDENIVRLFLLKMYDSNNNPSANIGDNAVNSTLPTEADNPYASIYPTFFLTKLIPKPYTNDGVEATGSLDYSGSLPRAYDLQLCETYLRAICEGFVDQTLSTENACETDFSTDFDYTYANLCNDAFGRSWISNITGSVRSDYPLTYGPLPDMILNTQVFNQLSSATNKLTKVRLPLPYRVLGRQKIYQDDAVVTPTWPDEDPSCNRDGFSKGIAFEYVPATATTLVSTGDWFDVGSGFNASTYLNIVCDGSNYIARTIKEVVELAFDTSDPLSWYAVSDDIRILASGSVESAGLFAKDITSQYAVNMELSNNPNGCSDQENWWYDTDSALWWNNSTNYVTEAVDCTYHKGAVELNAGDLTISDLAFGSVVNPVVGLTTCDYLPYKRVETSIVNTRHMILTVPTV